MNTKLLIGLVFLSFVLGLSSYPLIFGGSSEPVVPEILYAKSKPDTVTVEKYIEKEVPKYVYRTIVENKIEKVVEIDTVYITTEVPYFRSYKKFDFDYASSKIWAYAECSVDSFQNELTINWQDYFEEKQKPKLMKEKYNAYLLGGSVGLAAGLITMAFIK